MSRERAPAEVLVSAAGGRAYGERGVQPSFDVHKNRPSW